MLSLDPTLFEEAAISEDTRRLNEKIVEALDKSPDPWTLDPQVIRDARRNGEGVFPFEPFLADAEIFEIAGPHGPIMMRAIHPDNRQRRGVFLHFHGGGWRLRAADLQDQRLKRLANACGVTCLSVENRLAPEHPYPQGPDDCEAAALWLVNEGKERFNTKWLAIGGESAGAHLSAVTLLRLRDRHRLNLFHAAVLIAGCFDLAMTPSARNFRHGRLVMTSRDVANFVEGFIPAGTDLKDPDISPLYADLTGMPPAHFCVGTRDALLDDSLFMAPRWAQHQPNTELEVFPGGCHVFQYFDTLKITQQSLTRIEDFLNRLIA